MIGCYTLLYDQNQIISSKDEVHWHITDETLAALRFTHNRRFGHFFDMHFDQINLLFVSPFLSFSPSELGIPPSLFFLLLFSGVLFTLYINFLPHQKLFLVLFFPGFLLSFSLASSQQYSVKSNPVMYSIQSMQMGSKTLPEGYPTCGKIDNK